MAQTRFELPDQPYRFTPVPRRGGRADGWTSDRQHAFVWALARLPSVSAAARSVGMSARSAYRLRKAPGAEAFVQAWDEAWQIGLWMMRDTAMERALEGEEVAVRYRGRIVGKRKRYNNRLLVHTLISCELEQQMRLAEKRLQADHEPDFGRSGFDFDAMIFQDRATEGL